MDQRLDPYTPGSGVKPLKLAGRDRDLETFGVLISRLVDGQPERSLIYSGLRGVGKTVLLLEFETLAREAGWVCNDVEEVGSGDFRLTFAELAYQLLLSMSRKDRMRARAVAALGVLKAFSGGLPGGLRPSSTSMSQKAPRTPATPSAISQRCSSRSDRSPVPAAPGRCSSSMRCRRSTSRHSPPSASR
jgi:hypothetical protein